jgi:hypothetical protein
MYPPTFYLVASYSWKLWEPWTSLSVQMMWTNWQFFCSEQIQIENWSFWSFLVLNLQFHCVEWRMRRNWSRFSWISRKGSQCVTTARQLHVLPTVSYGTTLITVTRTPYGELRYNSNNHVVWHIIFSLHPTQNQNSQLRERTPKHEP